MVSASTPPDRPPLSPAQAASPVLAEAADETEMPLPSDPQTFFLGGIFALGVFAALYEASSVILPVVLAGAGVLVLDVGRTWSDLGRSNARHPEDRLRSAAPAKDTPNNN
jgi:hypothetical protein